MNIIHALPKQVRKFLRHFTCNSPKLCPAIRLVLFREHANERRAARSVTGVRGAHSPRHALRAGYGDAATTAGFVSGMAVHFFGLFFFRLDVGMYPCCSATRQALHHRRASWTGKVSALFRSCISAKTIGNFSFLPLMMPFCHFYTPITSQRFDGEACLSLGCHMGLQRAMTKEIAIPMIVGSGKMRVGSRFVPRKRIIRIIDA